MAFRNAFLAAVLATASATLAPNAASPALASEAQRDEPAIYDAVVVARYPHDPHAFTQGLLWHDGALYHFYCAVSGKWPNEVRGISVARSKPW